MIFLTLDISHYFSHIPFISLQRTLFWEAFGFDRFFNFPSFWASWMVLAAAHFYFWGVQDISDTPRILSPLGKSHGMVFNLARWYNGFSRLSCFSPYFSHIPFISLQRTLFWEAFGFDRFLIFPVSGRVAWFWQLPTFIFEECRTSPIPLE